MFQKLSSISWPVVLGMVTFLLTAVSARVAYLAGKEAWLREKLIRERLSSDMDLDDQYAVIADTYGRRGPTGFTAARLGKILAPVCGVAIAFFVDSFFWNRLPPGGNAREYSLANLAALLAGLAILFAVWRMSSGLGR